MYTTLPKRYLSSSVNVLISCRHPGMKVIEISQNVCLLFSLEVLFIFQGVSIEFCRVLNDNCVC